MAAMHYGMDKTAWHAVVAALNGKLVERQQAFQRRTMFRIFVLLFGGAMADTLALLFSIDDRVCELVAVASPRGPWELHGILSLGLD